MAENVGNARSTLCSFTGGTLHGTIQPRLLFGYAPSTLLEPVYMTVGKDADCLHKNITHRQVYLRDRKLDRTSDVGTTLGYRLGEVEVRS